MDSRTRPYTLNTEKAFSLIETVMALIILALVSSGVLAVISRCMISATDSMLRIQAFEVVRENMEALLYQSSVREMTEFGTSDKYPHIQWKTVVETFYEPITRRMWVQAICSAEYTDAAGATQTAELTHWLTSISAEQLREIIENKRAQQNQLDKQAELEEVDEQPDQEEVDEQPEQAETDEQKESDEQTEQDTQDKVDEQTEQEEQDDVKTIGGWTLEELVEMGFPRGLLEELFNSQ